MLFYSEQTVQDKVDSKNKEENELKKRLEEKELEKSAKEELWKQERMRRESEDKAWEVGTSSTQERKSQPIVDNEKNSESKVSLSKLEETILKVQQQMAEGTDHVNFEMKMKDQESKQGQDPKIPESKRTNKSPSYQEKRPVLQPTSKSPSPKKIKIRATHFISS